MAVNLEAPKHLHAVAGVELATTAAGIRYRDREDLLLVRLADSSQVAAVFTRNAFCAAPVTVARWHLEDGDGIRALLVNAGNANAGTGEPGLKAAEDSCRLAAEALGMSAAQVLPLSTGVIGELLPLKPIEACLPRLVDALDENRWLDAARAIMTTDTVAKGTSRRVELDGEVVTLTGIAKGSGMIRPDMATMLAFVATDARIEAEALRAALQLAVADSFNAITVDGDTSTNDACVLAATGRAANAVITENSAEFDNFVAALSGLCQELAQACIRDAEGATRFVTVSVSQARDKAEAWRVAYTVAESPLVKTAAFAGDPNWGRILAAVGRSGLDGLDVGQVDLLLDDVPVLRAGQPAPGYTERAGEAVVRRSEYVIEIRLGRGDAGAQVWTCDFSYDYVKINAEYRS